MYSLEFAHNIINTIINWAPIVAFIILFLLVWMSFSENIQIFTILITLFFMVYDLQTSLNVAADSSIISIFSAIYTFVLGLLAAFVGYHYKQRREKEVLLLGLISEQKSFIISVEARLKTHTKNIIPGEQRYMPHLPLSMLSSYFNIYNGSANKLGLIRNDDLMQSIIAVYTQSIDWVVRTNKHNDSVDEFWKLLFESKLKEIAISQDTSNVIKIKQDIADEELARIVDVAKKEIIPTVMCLVNNMEKELDKVKYYKARNYFKFVWIKIRKVAKCIKILYKICRKANK